MRNATTLLYPSLQLWSLEEQIAHKVAFLREHVLLPGRPPVVLLGHSIGAYMMVKVRLYRRDMHIRQRTGVWRFAMFVQAIVGDLILVCTPPTASPDVLVTDIPAAPTSHNVHRRCPSWRLRAFPCLQGRGRRMSALL